jgi:hypothetical protein
LKFLCITCNRRNVLYASRQILKDENSRDTYNRFGAGSLEFDPRLDEIMLFVDIGTVYLFWAVVMYIFTIPVGSRASRTWIAMVGVSVVVVHFLFTIGEVSLPELLKTTPMLATLTEHECILLLNSILPVVIVTLVFLAESMYFDLNRYTLLFLEKSVNRNKVRHGYIDISFMSHIILFIRSFLHRNSKACWNICASWLTNALQMSR